MQFDWQTVIALICVLAAACALIQRLAQWVNGSASGCHGCPSKCSSKELPLVSIDLSPNVKSLSSKTRAAR